MGRRLRRPSPFPSKPRTHAARGPVVVLGNIRAAKDLSGVLRTTLGPRGMQKLIVSKRTGSSVVTDDGFLILRSINIRHAAAKMVAGVGEAQARECGDGVASAVLLVGELLRKAESLLRLGIPQATVARGYETASEWVVERLEGQAEAVTWESRELRGVVRSVLGGKIPQDQVGAFGAAVMNAARLVAREREGRLTFNPLDVLLDVQPELTRGPVQVLPGIVVHVAAKHPGMPKRLSNARVFLLQGLLDAPRPRIKGEIIVRSPEELRALQNHRTGQLEDLADRQEKHGVNVIVCDGWAPEELGSPLAERGILLLQGVDRKTLGRLARATGANVLSRYTEAKLEDFGHAGVVEECRIAGGKGTRFDDCRESKVVTILLRRQLPLAFPVLDRAVHNALWALKAALDTGCVPGGGATEAALACELREYGMGISGKEQLAILAFAEALEGVPKALAEGIGANPIDVLVGLRAAQREAAGTAGLDLGTGQIRSVADAGIWDARFVKASLIRRAAQTAVQILHVDAAIPVRRLVKDMKDSDSVITPYPQWMRSEEHVQALAEHQVKMPTFRNMSSRVPRVKLEDMLEHQ